MSNDTISNNIMQETSFRDPAGFVYQENGIIYRQVNQSYKEHYDLLMSSGLYDKLVANHMLVSHQEIENTSQNQSAYKIIKPFQLPFISYPYEWSFSQLKLAGILTLRVQELALEHGMTLKDASSFNVQFHNGKPIFIDTLSFEKYNEGEAWNAYGQFARFFLAPLVLASDIDVELLHLQEAYIDGIPLNVVVNILPKTAFLAPSKMMHIYLHNKSITSSQTKYEDNQQSKKTISKKDIQNIVASLIDMVKGLHLKSSDSEWGDYYNNTNYTNKDFDKKIETIKKYIAQINPKKIIDIGANNGKFTRIAKDISNAEFTLALDIDPIAIDLNSRYSFKEEENLLALQCDLTNPTPSIGWFNKERKGIIERINEADFDVCLALALIHHICIGNNISFDMFAKFLTRIAKQLIIEFVPKSDSQVQKLLHSRADIFDSYDKEHFEAVFSKYFEILQVDELDGGRNIYLMKLK